MYHQWPEAAGGDVGFRQTGNLTLFKNEPPHNLEWADRTVEKAKALGIRAEVISPEDVRRMQHHCMKYRASKEMRDPRHITMKNGSPATQGLCPTCGTKMFRIGRGQSNQPDEPI